MKNNPKVLLVDDDANLRKTLSDILKFKGYAVAAAVNGAAAIAEAQRAAVNVALIDLMLPDMSGIEVMERIKKGSPYTEAIILTGHASLATAIEATSKGAFSYLLKPYEIEDLLLHIRHAIERQQAQEEIRRLASFPRLNPQPVIEIAPSGEVTYANPAADKLFPDLRLLGGQHPLLIGLGDIYATFRQNGLTEMVREVTIGESSYKKHIYYVPESELIRIAVEDVTEHKRTEESLRKLSQAVEQSPSAIIITDLDANIEYVNATFVEATGYSRAEVIGQNPRLLQSGKTPGETYKEMWACLKRGEVWKGELTNRRKDGSEYIEAALISPMRQADGRVTNYLAIKKDITLFKQAQEALRDSRENLHRLLNSMAEGAYGVDANGNCTFVNLSFLQMLGYRNESEVLGKHTHELMHHSHANGSPYPADECRAYLAYRTNQASNVSDEVFWRKDGVAIPVEYWSHPIETDGAVTGAIVTFVDITERKRTEESLKNCAAKYHSMFELSTDAIMLLDEKGFFDCNPATLRIFGCTTRDDFISKHPAELSPPTQPGGEDSMSLANQRIVAALENGSNSFEWVHRRLDGTEFPAEVLLTALELGGKPVLQATVRDITARKQAESQLTEQLDELRRWHDATSGREKRILELKHEVNELLGKSGQPPRYPSAESQDKTEK